MVNKEKQSLFREPGDVLATTENYIEEHGTEAFEMLIATSKVWSITIENYIEEHGTEAFEMLIATSKVWSITMVYCSFSSCCILNV